MSKSYSALVLLLAAATLTATPAVATDASAADDTERATEVYRIKDSDGKDVEVLTGKAALSHFKNLKAKSPKAFDKSVTHLQERGFTPTESVVVIRSIHTGIVPTQSSVETSEGEIVFWSWTDGDPSTWEGSMYATKYATGQETVYDGQIDTPTNDVRWEYMSYDTPRQRYQTTQTQPENEGIYLLASLRSPRSAGIETIATSRPKIREWVGCVVGGCMALGMGCVLSGPLYPECVILGCAGTKAGCTASWIINNWP
jgi:hypothetical protein